jgi:hypothetical protein
VTAAHPALLALAEAAWQAQQAAQVPPQPPETTAELVASCWAASARRREAQERAEAALARMSAGT